MRCSAELLRSGAPLIRARHGPERSTQVGVARLAHCYAPISGKPEIGVCSATTRCARVVLLPGTHSLPVAPPEFPYPPALTTTARRRPRRASRPPPPPRPH